MRMTDAAAPAAATRVCVEAGTNVTAVAPAPRVRSSSSSETLEPSPAPPPRGEEHGGGGSDDKTDTTTQDGFCLQTCQPFDKEEWSTKDETEKENAYDTVDKPRKMLSRDSSQDYTDSTGIDLHEFLVNTLKNNPRDRIMLLKLEQDILDFISNNESQKRKFPPMTSYHRMLLHRVAAYFGMDHNVDPSGKSVIINKTASSRIPDQKFSEHITDDRVDDFQKRYILKRENSSFDRQDSVGDHFVLDKRSQNGEACLSSQQRRHMFSLRAGRSGASRQSSSETDATARYGELRPWSSTDSSDSSNRLQPPRPPFTKASSFSGTSTSTAASPGLVRGDSTASSKSTTGRLSKTGSESSSVGSSTSSLSRSQPPLQLPVPVPPPRGGNGGVPGSSTPTPTATALPNINAEAKALSPCRPDVAAIKTGPQAAAAALALQPALSTVVASPTATNFYLVPLESTGMPPGATVLVNTHTGLPLVNSDGSAVLYNAATATGHAHMVGSRPQQAKTPHLHHQQPIAAQQQAPTTNHLLSQPETLNTQFSHVSLARQTQTQPGDGGGAPDAPHHHHFPPAVYHHHHHHASPSVLIHGPPPPPLQQHQLAGYVLAGLPGGFQGGLPVPGPPTAGGGGGGHHPALQAAPVAAPYSHHHHHGGTNPGAHHHGYPHGTVVPGPAAYPQAGPAMNQSFVQQHTYIQQPVPQVTTCYCAPANYTQCSGPQQQHHYRPSATPLPYNCPPSQHLTQQQAYATLMPNSVPGYQTLMGVQSAANPTLAGGQQSNMAGQMQGMMVQYPPMPSYQQVLVPQGSQMVPQQSYQQPLMYACQQGQGALPVAGMQPCYNLLSPNQHTTMSSTVSFLPAQAVEQLQFPQAASPCVSQQHTGGQQYTGEGHYPLLGQPLQYKPPMGPPLIHATHMMANHQAHMGIWHGSQGRRTGGRKSVATDLSVGEAVSGRILEVTDLPEGISCGEAQRLLGELCRGGAMIKWLSERQPAARRPQDTEPAAKKQTESPVQELPPGSCKPPRDLASS